MMLIGIGRILPRRILPPAWDRWDRSVEIYDRVLSRNQSNQQAREKRAYALERLSKEDEPDQERYVEKQY